MLQEKKQKFGKFLLEFTVLIFFFNYTSRNLLLSVMGLSSQFFKTHDENV